MPVKSCIIYAAPEINPGKVRRLDELHVVHRSYVQACIDTMIADKPEVGTAPNRVPRFT